MIKQIICVLSLCLTLVATQANAANNTKVKLETNMGDIVIALNSQKAPISVSNFLSYVNDGYFDNLIFHRVIPNFMIQGGGFTASMQQKVGRAPIKNEADNGLTNKKYTIAMARTNDPHSASSQFFINTKDNDFLNYTAPTASGWGYAVFGEVISGKEVVDAISAVETGSYGPHGDVPTKPVIITKASIIK